MQEQILLMILINFQKDWDKVIDVNLKGVFLCCQQVIKYMPKFKNNKYWFFIW